MLVYWLDIVGTAVFAISGVLLAGNCVWTLWCSGTGRGNRSRRRNNSRHGAGSRPGILGERSHRSGRCNGHQHADHRAGAPAKTLTKWMLPVLDAVGLAVFVGIGVNKAFNAEAGPLIAVCMGVITGVGGGIIRDVLAREIPMIYVQKSTQLPVLLAVLSTLRLITHFRTTGNSQYDGHGRDAIDSAGGYSLAS